MGPMLSSLSALLLIFSASLVVDCKVFNVLDYGAKRDASADCENALVNAWNAACNYDGWRSQVLIPRGTYTFKQALLTGPCKPKQIVFDLRGTFRAYPGYYGQVGWLTFRYVDGLIVTGGGTLDGRGETTWHHNNCLTNSRCGPFPTNLRFDMVTNSLVQDITSLNSKNVHINIFGSSHMNLTNIKIIAPADSPNTDGIHMGLVTRIRITDSRIATGDDCISMSPGSRLVGIYRVVCGPGHGISVGSLGGNDGEVVAKIRVKDCTFVNTENGLRVKTWAASKVGSVSKLVFENIKMNNVTNPIIIDQEYCPSGACNFLVPSKVQIKDVLFRNVYGTSRSEVAVNLKCSKSNPCMNVAMQNINLRCNQKRGNEVMQCLNVQGRSFGTLNPESCL